MMKKLLFYMAVLLSFCACQDEQKGPVTAISLDTHELELFVGDSYTFQVTHTPPEADAPKYEWNAYSYSPEVGDAEGYVEIDQEGKITALKQHERILVQVKTKDGTELSDDCVLRISNVKAEKVVLDKTETTMTYGETLTLAATISPENTTYKEIVWKTSNAKIAIVEEDKNQAGKANVKAVGAGEVTITATVGYASASCKITVNGLKLEDFAFAESEKEVVIGESFTLTPVFKPAEGVDKTLSWSSSDNSVVSVDENGNMTALKVGTCTIKAVAKDGGFEASCNITVNPKPIENLKFGDYSYNVEIGGERQLSVIVTPEDADVSSITWYSSDPMTVPVDENGVVRGNARGNATITATAENGVSASCKVYVVSIEDMMNAYVSSSSMIILNGYYTGQAVCTIRNGSSQTVRLTKFHLFSNFNTIDEKSLDVVLGPKETYSLKVTLNRVFDPSFSYEIEYNGAYGYVSGSLSQD